MMFSFSQPEYLYILFLIPIFFVIHFISLSIRKKRALKFANFDAISNIEGIEFFSKNLFNLFMSCFILFLLIFSVSGLTLHMEPIKGVSFYSFVIAIDSSQIMAANDISPSRLEASKINAINFINELPFGTNIGVISFSTTTYIESEPTINKNLAVGAVKKIKISEYGGSDLHEVIVTSNSLLYDEDNRAVILISDGQFNMIDVGQSIDYAKKNKLVIYCIGVGTKDGGETGYEFVSELNEENLKRVSHETGGYYFSAQNQLELSDAFVSVMKLAKGKVDLELKEYLIIFAIILFTLQFFVVNTRYLFF